MNEAAIIKLEGEVKALWIAVEGRVKWNYFTWITGILMAVVVGMFWLLYNKIEFVSNKQDNNFQRVFENTSAINSDVSSIKGKLDPYNFEFPKK